MANKVLIVNFSDKGGGAEMFSSDLAKGLDATMYTKDGFIKTIDLQVKDNREYKKPLLDRTIHKLSRYSSWRHMSGYLDSYHGTYYKLSKSDIYRESEIVHLNNIHGGWFDIKAIERIDKEKKLIWTLHDMWSMTGGEAYMFDYTGYQTGNARSPYLDNYPLKSPGVDRRSYYLELKRNLYKRLKNTTFVPVSSWLEDCLRKSYVYHDGMKISTIKNGVDLDIFHRKSTRKKNEIPKVLFFNSKSPFKATQLGVSALKKLSNEYELILIGEPLSQIPEANVYADHVSSRTELAELFNSVDLMLFPSLAENMPLTVLECMACGAIPVCLPVGGIPEIVIDGVTGYLADSTHHEDLAKKLDSALVEDRSKISEQAIDFIKANHDFTDVLKKYQDLYTEQLA